MKNGIIIIGVLLSFIGLQDENLTKNDVQLLHDANNAAIRILNAEEDCFQKVDSSGESYLTLNDIIKYSEAFERIKRITSEFLDIIPKLKIDMSDFAIVANKNYVGIDQLDLNNFDSTIDSLFTFKTNFVTNSTVIICDTITLSSKYENEVEVLNNYDYQSRNAVYYKKILERLKKYKRKFGKDSPKLNAIETILNICIFSPELNSDPNPWEIILGYNAAYFVVGQNKGTDKELTIPSAIEGGLRYYLFCEEWYCPNYLALGVNLSNKNIGVLTFPEFREDDYWGIFINIDEFKLSYQYQFMTNDFRILISKQIQFIPYLF